MFIYIGSQSLLINTHVQGRQLEMKIADYGQDQEAMSWHPKCLYELSLMGNVGAMKGFNWIYFIWKVHEVWNMD